MANGDAAQAVGFTPVPSTKDKRLGYDDINRAADFTAAHMTSGGHDFSRITGQAATSQIANGAITTAKHADASVTTPKLAPGAVTKPKLSPGSVDGDIVATTVSKSGPLNIQGRPCDCARRTRTMRSRSPRPASGSCPASRSGWRSVRPPPSP